MLRLGGVKSLWYELWWLHLTIDTCLKINSWFSLFLPSFTTALYVNVLLLNLYFVKKSPFIRKCRDKRKIKTRSCLGVWLNVYFAAFVSVHETLYHTMTIEYISDERVDFINIYMPSDWRHNKHAIKACIFMKRKKKITCQTKQIQNGSLTLAMCVYF